MLYLLFNLCDKLFGYFKVTQSEEVVCNKFIINQGVSSIHFMTGLISRGLNLQRKTFFFAIASIVINL